MAATKQYNIVVLGAGAVGSVFAAAFVDATTFPVYIVEIDDDRRAALLEKNLIINHKDQSIVINADQIKCTSKLKELDCNSIDLLIVAVKDYHLDPTLLDDITQHLSEHTTILLCQNGIPRVELLRRLAPSNPLIAVFNAGAKVVKGAVHLSKGISEFTVDIGTMGTLISEEEMDKLRIIFADNALSIGLTGDITQKVLRKLQYATVGAFTAIRGILAENPDYHFGDLLKEIRGNPIVYAVVSRLIEEVTILAVEMGVEASQLLSMEEIIKRVAHNGEHQNSLARDLLHAKPIESATILDALVIQSKEYAVDMPVFTRVREMILHATSTRDFTATKASWDELLLHCREEISSNLCMRKGDLYVDPLM